MSVITVSRELGSGGAQIAREVAHGLGYRVVGHEMINEAARRAGAPEVALAAIDDLGLLDLHPSHREERAYQQALREVMNDLAARDGVVIIDQAGQLILAGRSNVLHVRIIAPAPVRRDRIASSEGISRAAARARVDESDRTRRDYLQSTYAADWNDPELYDLVLNTERLRTETAADVISRALRGLEGV